MKGRRGNEDGQKHAIYTLAELRGIRWREIYRDLQIMRLCFKRPPLLRGLFSLFFPSPALGRPCVSSKDSLLAAFRQNFLHLCFDLGRKIEEDRKKECLGSWNIFFLFLRGCRRSKFRYRWIFEYIYTSKVPSRNEARIQHLPLALGEYKGGSHTRTWPRTIYQPRKSRKSSFRESKNWLWKTRGARNRETEKSEKSEKTETINEAGLKVGKNLLLGRKRDKERERRRGGMFATKRQAVNKVANSPGREEEEEEEGRGGGLRPFIFLQNLCSSHLRHPLAPSGLLPG